MGENLWTLPDPKSPYRVGALREFEKFAERYLPKSIYAYVRPGVEADACYENSIESFRDWSFAWRVLRGSATPDMRVEIFGHQYSAPFGIAPMGGACLGSFRGDLDMVKAATTEDIPAIISAGSTIPMEELRRAAPKAWMQMYAPSDRHHAFAMTDRVQRAGFDVLVVTVDTPTAGNRLHFDRLNFTIPVRLNLSLIIDALMHPRWLFGTMFKTLLRDGMPHLENFGPVRGGPIISSPSTATLLKPQRLLWDDLSTIRDKWKGKLVIKGILAPADAMTALEKGVDGIILSNHGGRQMDAAVAPMRVLADVVAAAPKLAVMIDGGMHWGTDIMKAYALGAKYAFVGRPFWYANAVGGESLVTHAIKLLKAEINRNMIMMGLSSMAELDQSYLVSSTNKR
jgi:L-lactate dehydrogenase (cytochrome)